MPDFHVTFRNVLHSVNLRHGTDGFTSLPKEGVFSPWKIQRLRSGLNPRTWVSKAITLPLDHRSRIFLVSSFLLLFFLLCRTVPLGELVRFLFLYFLRKYINTYFVLVLGWGFQPVRVQADINLLFYSLLTPLPLLFGMLFIFSSLGSLHFKFPEQTRKTLYAAGFR